MGGKSRPLLLKPYATIPRPEHIVVNDLGVRPPPSAPGCQWRLVPSAPLGEVHGLPSCRGTLYATDGVQGILILGNGSKCMIHVCWFIPDVEPDLNEAFDLDSWDVRSSSVRRAGSTKRKQITLDDIL
jgi:hypothetical protein